MKQVVVVKLTPTPEQYVALKATLELCNAGANMVARFAHTAADRRPFALQKHVYADLKASGLSAQPAIRVIKKVADAYATRPANLAGGNYGPPGSKRYAKVVGKPIRFRQDAGQPFDDRCLSWQIDQSTVSIWTTTGRLRGVGFVCAPWQLKLLTARKGESDLVFRDGHFYLHATVDTDTPAPLVPADDPAGWLGVDLGIVNLAVTSADDPTNLDARWSGGAVTARRKRNQALRAALQKVGTKSAKRKLKARRRKEARYVTDVNHQLSKSVVAQAQRTGQGIAVEDLSGIRDRVRLAKAQRQQLHSWAFAQLRDQITYKAQAAGLPVQVVDPRNTSRTCHRCGHCNRANRPSQAVFRCRHCRWSGHADHNAAVNIAALGYQSYRAAQSTVPKTATPLTAS
ncbi:transposase [Nocardia sp. NBC_00565]|uniref:RNA-guided endonuclease InsQ/TnpB family protein n=1 Tax=Nocardia sp. NBC_00565 TaxID=2975993 RepID=UPI002E803CB7|nr:transposase [Nocardia sp. NBC_00565]WUC08255.1 transposase [Nocardia sp. NBC_00565]